MSKDTFYFSHDYNSRNDPKMVRLLMKTGVVGFGVYWCVVEMLYEQGGYISLLDCERIAFELRVDSELVRSVIGSDLFSKNQEIFWSESVIRRLNERKVKTVKARESANKRWDNERAMRTHSEPNARKERKGKEIKEKNNNGDFFENECATKIENDFALFGDGSSQKLTLSQQSLLAMGELKPSDVKKVNNQNHQNVLR